MMQRPSLLIADDDPVIRVFLERGLSAGFDVVGTAANSVEAVELARSTRPDAALVDVEMPMGGGLRAVEGITEVTPETAIVVLSGDESESSVRELMLAGAVAYRRKGVDLRVLTDSLVAAIAAHGNSRRSAA